MTRLPLLALRLIAACGLSISTPWARAQEVQPTVVDSVQLDMRSTDTQTTFVFTKKVVVTGTDLKLTCDRLEVITTRKGDPAATIGKLGQFKSMVAEGDVHIIQADREAACGRAEVLPDDDKIILTDHPVVKDLSNGAIATGPRMVLYRGERRAVIEGADDNGSRIILPAIKDLGFDKNQEARAAARGRDAEKALSMETSPQRARTPPTTLLEAPPAAPATGGPVEIRTEGLVKNYGQRPVVNGVNIRVGAGEVVGLLGPNGAGKTTTFYMVVGLVPASSGRVFINGQDATALRMHRRARLGVGYLPQEPSIFRKLTVSDNIMAIVETLSGVSAAERAQLVKHHLDELSIAHLAGQYAYTLSGGERRRLEIARALVTRPRFLLMDEPFAGVDPISVTEVQKIILELRARGIGVLITDHNVRETLRIVDRGYIIHKGKVMTEGSGDFLINDPQARELYLGRDFNM